MKTPRWSRLPTEAELDAFTGLHCHIKYREAVRTGWRCPSCGRSARELVRWAEIRGAYWRERHADEHGMGFTVSIVSHHCHGAGRFPPTLICGDCNSADGAAKRKNGLPESWSFSPAEIARFATLAPHSGRTRIDHDLALEIYRRANPPFAPAS